jgi:quercetin dioxygenase-like cupin family protein
MHSHESEQVTMLEAGTLRFTFGEEEKVVHAGDVLPIPLHAPHRVEALEDSFAVVIFLLSVKTGAAATMCIYVNRKLPADSST